MTQNPNKSIPLPVTAHRLRVSWAQAWRLLLSGELKGEKRGCRWFVFEESLEELMVERLARSEAEEAG